MRRQLRELLRLCDLREEEVGIYLLLLKLRHATIPMLIAETGLNRMTVYRCVKHMREQGLLNTLPLNDKQDLYAPLPLDELIGKVEKEERRLRRLVVGLKGLDRFLPYMDLHDDNDLVEVCEGIDAFREEYLSFPDTCKAEYLHIGNMENYWKTAQMTYECPEERSFINRRLDRGISCRIVNAYSPAAESFRENDTREMRTSKLTDELPIKQNYLGIGEKNAAYFICNEENPRVIVMRQPELLELQKQQFEGLWRASI